MSIKYQEADLNDVLRYYVQGFQDTDSFTLRRTPDGQAFADCFVDTNKGVVVFKLYGEDKE